MKKLFFIRLIVSVFLVQIINATSGFAQAVTVKEVQQFSAFNDIINYPVISFSPDSKWLAFGEQKDKLILYPIGANDKKVFLTNADSYLTATAFSPGGEILLVGFKSGVIKMFDMKTQEFTQEIKAHEKPVLDIIFAPNGKTFYSGSKDNTIKAWLVSGELVKTYEAKNGAFTLHLRGNSLYYNNQKSSNCIGIIDLETGVEKGRLPGTSCSKVDISKDNTLAAVGSIMMGEFQLIDIATGKQLVVLKDQKGSINDVEFSANGMLLATSAGGKSVVLWDVPSRTPLQKIDLPDNGYTTTFSPDGKWLASQTSFTVVLYQLQVLETVSHIEKEYHNGKYVGGLRNGLRSTTPGDSSTFTWKDGKRFVGAFEYDRMLNGKIYHTDGRVENYKLTFHDTPIDVAFLLTIDETNGLGGRSVEKQLYFLRIRETPSDISDKEISTLAHKLLDKVIKLNKGTWTEEAFTINRTYEFASFKKTLMESAQLQANVMTDVVNYIEEIYRN